MHTAATDGTSGSVLGARAFWHSEAILPGVSLPSRVVRSTIDTAVLSPHSFEPFLMLRVANLATRSSMPTWSTGPTSAMNRSKEDVRRRCIFSIYRPLLPRLCVLREIDLGSQVQVVLRYPAGVVRAQRARDLGVPDVDV